MTLEIRAEHAKCIKREKSNAADNFNCADRFKRGHFWFDSEKRDSDWAVYINEDTLLQQKPQSTRRKTHERRDIEYEIRK